MGFTAFLIPGLRKPESHIKTTVTDESSIGKFLFHRQFADKLGLAAFIPVALAIELLRHPILDELSREFTLIDPHDICLLSLL